jgi:hypothetical protein
MGLIQEIRFSNVRSDKWDQWVRKNKIDKDEIMIRKIRNRAAHQTDSRISKEDVFKAFQLTLERCLRL